MLFRALIVVIACLSTTVFVEAAPAASAPDAGRPTLGAPQVGEDVTVYRGRSVPGTRVRLARRTATGWTRFASTRADARGRYVAKVDTPTDTWKVRAVTGHGHSPVRTVEPPATAPTPEPTPAPTDPTPEPAPETDACGVRPEKADGTLWSCTFADDFDGTALDTSTWLVQETWYSGMTTGAHACYVNQPDTIAVSDGALHLSAHRNLEPFTCKSPYGDFTTTSTAATVATRNSFTQTYGRFEFRAKFPDIAGTPGAHSALWLYPRSHTYGAWPASGEIDVAEWFSALPAKVYPSVHYLGEQPPESTGLECAVAGAGTKYHTYGVEWTPTVMRFFYDGNLCWEHAWTPDGMTAPQPFDKPFYLVLTQAFGARWNEPTTATPDDITMDVDWARAWS